MPIIHSYRVFPVKLNDIKEGLKDATHQDHAKEIVRQIIVVLGIIGGVLFLLWWIL